MARTRVLASYPGFPGFYRIKVGSLGTRLRARTRSYVRTTSYDRIINNAVLVLAGCDSNYARLLKGNIFFSQRGSVFAACLRT